ncbi:PREDICTED: sideroflexin-1, partial [Nicrophorus vespilloides]|uniref:Sideroflexin-1 n=1 Tax=Nicrophorus vespilloides TaxID=110193 RepID=A0ABM1M6J8_NICVS
ILFCRFFFCRCREPLPKCMSVDELWRAKQLYDSAFHPDTGDKMNIIGRMSAQVPMNMLITGGMMAFYKSTPAVIFWQWLNQSFNALVNYTNRSGDASLSDKQLLTSYVFATGGAVATALGLNKALKNGPPLIGRLVPFAAVAAANCVNIPFMRAQELRDGTPIYDQNDNRLGNSKAAAQSGIKQVICSRIAMATPGMVLTPFVMNHLERRGTLCRYPWATLPIQVALLGVCLTFATPLACAVFKQKAEIRFSDLEPELKEKLEKKLGKDIPYILFFNKGL